MIDTADIANYAEDNTPYSEGKNNENYQTVTKDMSQMVLK